MDRAKGEEEETTSSTRNSVEASSGRKSAIGNSEFRHNVIVKKTEDFEQMSETSNKILKIPTGGCPMVQT